MRVGVSSDEVSHLTEFVLDYLTKKGLEPLRFGVLRDKSLEWADASIELAEAVRTRRCDEGVLFCWTGTGSSIAANKVPGVRAALCVDAEEAKGARKWNHANVLVMSLRLTSEPLAKEILDAWYSTPFGDEAFDVRNVKRLTTFEKELERTKP